MNAVNKKGMNLMHFLLRYNGPADPGVVKCLLLAGFDISRFLTKEDFLTIRKIINRVLLE